MTHTGDVQPVNTKDIAQFRRYLKPEHDLMKIFDIFNVYIMKESSEIYHYECQPFAFLEKEQQELFMGNFKKMLSGRFDEKLFELKFRQEAEEHAQSILLNGLEEESAEDWMEQMLKLVDKMLKDVQYDHDTVITFIRGEFFKPSRRRSEESEESERDEVYSYRYILCTMNATEPPQKTLVFDYVSKTFKYNIALDPVVKLASPEAGFLFPALTDGAADVNRILYSSGKVNEPDIRLIENVLNGELGATAVQDKTMFEDIVNEVAGDQLDTTTLAQVYEEVNRFIEEHEEETPPALDYKDVERVLNASGLEDVNSEKVEQAFKQVADDVKHELKASSVLPKYTSKSIKINTKVATITISPQDLKYVRQVDVNGKRCLLIEIDEDTVIEGFTMRTEAL